MANVNLSVNTGETKTLTFNTADTYVGENLTFTISATSSDSNIVAKAYKPVAHFSSNVSRTSGSYKITINSTSSWMLGFTVRVYQGYTFNDIHISGYNYGSNHWYSPKAFVVGETDNITVSFGYTSTNLWVAIPAGSYTGLDIIDVTNGYTQIDDSAMKDLFTIAYVDRLVSPQSTVTARRVSFEGHTHDYAASNHTHSGYAISTHSHSFDSLSFKPTTIAGYGITDALTIGTTSTTAAAGNHSHAFSSITSKPTTIAGYGITDALTIGTTATTAAAGNHSHAFSSITSKPTTIAGYGITDALTIGTTATTAAAGNHTHSSYASSGHTHTTSIATSTGTSSISLSPYTKYKLIAGGTSYVFTTPEDTTRFEKSTYTLDSNGTGTLNVRSVDANRRSYINDTRPIASYQYYIPSTLILMYEKKQVGNEHYVLLKAQSNITMSDVRFYGLYHNESDVSSNAEVLVQGDLSNVRISSGQLVEVSFLAVSESLVVVTVSGSLKQANS